ncbi:Ankyrin repeat and Ankyrin repeat-containing domain-containing protein [Strongyloides ratti]|uniref:Ankyrin repeat and Ankyrin repeat-containing domain-containing protein n=1 Tax=Strongyloides ratti TaxID=34506 RepID=A0A090LNZ1_STRRB|nr:Ankyrin repeat and Ankyrin repeat-containing domain-containing protein [Strongyloides ratti]CEF71481.1 Ankyrin repeat and Ankyrin repeat-containing domain-containing protein [Strongyloides ratti]
MKLLSGASYNFLRDCEEGNLAGVQKFIENKWKKKVILKYMSWILIPKTLSKKINLCKYKYSSNGYNPLHLAILSGNVKLIEYLIEVDKKLIYQKDDNGLSPFHLITLSTNSDIWREIVKKREFILFIEDIPN